MAAPADFSQLAQALSQGVGQKPVAKAGTINKPTNLNDLIKTIRVLNRSDEDSTISDTAFGANKAPNANSYIMSDADAEVRAHLTLSLFAIPSFNSDSQPN